MKHTNGEWRAFESNSVTEEAFGATIRQDEPLGYDIAVIWNDVKEWRANAKLIAAAPDLLETLIIATRMLKLNGHPMEKAEQAIKKATE